MKTFQELAKSSGYEIRHFTKPLGVNESISQVVKPFEFSEQNGGSLNGFQFYNNFYLYPTK